MSVKYTCVSYPTRKSHIFCAVLYCHLKSVLLYHTFPHYLIQGTILGVKIIEHNMCAFICSTNSVETIRYSKKNLA